MDLINDVIWWATYNNEVASLAAGAIGCALWSTGYVCVSELRRYYRTRGAEREHIKSPDKE